MTDPPGALPLVTVVFSRDRAMQLEACLASFAAHCREAASLPVDVLYTGSSPALAAQYGVVEREWRDRLHVRFHHERDFRRDLLDLLGTPARPAPGRAGLTLRRLLGAKPAAREGGGPPYVLFLVDDNVFVRPFSLTEALGALAARPRALGFSLRLGRNTTYCYSHDAPQRVPPFVPVAPGVAAYDWTTAEHDFGYPLEVSSSVYSIPGVGSSLADLPFGNPNTLEAQFAATGRSWAGRRPELLCYEQSVTFCNAVNKVQAVFDNRAGADQELTAEELARRFDEGCRIDTAALSGFVPEACHGDVPFSFTQS